MHQKNYSKGVFLYTAPVDRRSWKKQINLINSLSNVNHIEVWIEEILKLSELKFLKSLLGKHKILIHGPFVHLSLISPHREIRDITIKLYLQTLEIAEILGAKLVTFHCGTKTKFISKEIVTELLIQNLQEIKNYYNGKIAFSIENLRIEEEGIQVHYPGSLKDLAYLKNLLPWLNFTVDIGHAFQNNENLDKISKFLRRYKNSILDIHLQDATLKGKAHLTLGKGELNVNAFFQLLNKISYAGYVTLETLPGEDTRKSWEKISKL